MQLTVYGEENIAAKKHKRAQKKYKKAEIFLFGVPGLVGV
jgi:uncharacterized protein YhhL (DUF1145 family)